MARTPQELTLALECYKQATISAEDALSKLLDNAIAKLREEDSIDIVRVLNFVSLVTTAVGYVMAPSTLRLASLLAGGTP